MGTVTRRAAKYQFWASDGVRYGRVSVFGTDDDFLTRIYNVTPEEDEDYAFFEDWKAGHPLATFLEAERERVKRNWYRFTFARGFGEKEQFLDDAEPGARGAFELWSWEQ